MAYLVDFEKKLRRYNLESKLELCRKMAHTIESKFPHPKQFFNFQHKDKQDNFFENINLFELEYFSLSSIICDELNGDLKILSNLNDFVKIINHFTSYGTAPSNKPIEDHQWTMFFIRLGIQQHKSKNMIDDLHSYNYYYNFQNESIDMNDLFIENFKYPFADYALFALSLFILSSKCNNPIHLNDIYQICTFTKFSQNKIVEMLKVFCINSAEFQKLYSKNKNIDEKYKVFDYNPLTKFPILMKTETYLLPIPQYLFNAITEGFYHRLCESKIKQFRENFGKHVFEEYVGSMLSSYFQENAIIKEFSYCNKSKKSPDYILQKNDEMIFIEIKGTTPSIRIRENNLDTFINQLEKGFGVGVKQCIKKEKDFENGTLTHPNFIRNKDEINEIYYIIINLEDFHIPPSSSIIRILTDFCSKNNVEYKPERKPLMISISLFIYILEMHNGDLFNFMKKWSVADKLEFPYHYIDFSKIEKKKYHSTNFLTELFNRVKINTQFD